MLETLRPRVDNHSDKQTDKKFCTYQRRIIKFIFLFKEKIKKK